jgi:hypothetical protein
LKFKIKDLKDVQDVKFEWKSAVEETSYAWFWSEYYEHCFRINVLKASLRFVKDESFFVYLDSQLCGLVPFVVVKSNDFDGLEASYDKPLPWPLVMDSINNKKEVISFIFKNIDEKSHRHRVKKISLQYSPPGHQDDFNKYFSSVVNEYKYLSNSHFSHFVNVGSDTLTQIRKRYIRYVKKLSPFYELKIVDKKNFNNNLPKLYMSLHIKDSGSINRPLETYVAQFDYIVEGEGFAIQAINKSSKKVVGMLIICISKNCAYDGSVAVDPSYKDDFISHLMKWKAISYMNEQGINYYELGKVAESSNFLEQFSRKNHGISFFKDGWSRGESRKIHTYEKYFSKSALNETWIKKLNSLIDYYDI